MCLGIPGEIVSIEPGEPLFGEVAFAGINRRVCLVYVPEAKVGEFVIVHVGFALTVVDPEEAQRTLELLDELGQAMEMESNTEQAKP